MVRFPKVLNHIEGNCLLKKSAMCFERGKDAFYRKKNIFELGALSVM